MRNTHVPPKKKSFSNVAMLATRIHPGWMSVLSQPLVKRFPIIRFGFGE